MSQWNRKVVVITGAGSGIGRALAQQLAARGAHLALSDRDPEGLAATVASLPAGTRCQSHRLDVADRAAFFTYAEQVLAEFGQVDYVVNNAGATVIGTIAHLTIEEIEWQLGVNLWGVIYGTKAFLPHMLSRRSGCIVNISSVFGMIGFPAQGAYNISKFGVRGLTECLWSELEGTGVRAVSVHPGGIRTNIEKAGRRCAAAGADEEHFTRNADKLLRTAPDDCAADIIAGLEAGKRRILTGHRARTIFWLSRLLPQAYVRLVRAMAN